MARRILAVVLPELACELARATWPGGRAPERLAVVVSDDPLAPHPGDVLQAVTEAARRCGVREGQTVAEARAVVSSLAVRAVEPSRVTDALASVAESLLAYGPRVALCLDTREQLRDSAWVDLTGCAHLGGGEVRVAFDVASRVEALGHRVRVAIADGPRIARAVALHAPVRESIVAPGEGAQALARLPLSTLPLDDDTRVWLARLGLLLVGDLERLPAASAGPRLGARAGEALALARGLDPAPLVAHEPRPTLSEETSFGDAVESLEPLAFVLRGLVARVSARLEGRGQATTALAVTLRYDASIARLRGVAGDAAELAIVLPAPLAREGDLFRAIRAKLERARLEAPVRALAVTAARIVRAPRVQLDLGRDAAVSPDALPVLLAELSAEIGDERVGVLACVPVHRPEAQSRLAPALGARPRELPFAWPVPAATRVLARPLALEVHPSELRAGMPLVVDRRLYTIARVAHDLRLDEVEWWAGPPVGRDYLRLWLTSEAGGAGAWVYVDKATRRVMLQGYAE